MKILSKIAAMVCKRFPEVGTCATQYMWLPRVGHKAGMPVHNWVVQSFNLHLLVLRFVGFEASVPRGARAITDVKKYRQPVTHSPSTPASLSSTSFSPAVSSLLSRSQASLR